MQGDPGHIYSVYDDPTGDPTPIETDGEATDKRLAELLSPESADLTASDATAFTAQDAAVVDTTYGAEEAGVIGNNRTRVAELVTVTTNLRTRVNELEAVLKEHGMLV